MTGDVYDLAGIKKRNGQHYSYMGPRLTNTMADQEGVEDPYTTHTPPSRCREYCLVVKTVEGEYEGDRAACSSIDSQANNSAPVRVPPSVSYPQANHPERSVNAQKKADG